MVVWSGGGGGVECGVVAVVVCWWQFTGWKDLVVFGSIAVCLRGNLDKTTTIQGSFISEFRNPELNIKI